MGFYDGMNEDPFGQNLDLPQWGGTGGFAGQYGPQDHPLAGILPPSEYPDLDASGTTAMRQSAAGAPAIPGMPTKYAYEPATKLPAQGMWGNWLDNLATSLATTPLQAPNNFGGGLLSGFAKGFSTARLKNMSEREKLQKAMDDYAAQRNAANIKATADAREARQKQLDLIRQRTYDRQKFVFEEAFKAGLKKNDDNTYTVTSEAMLPYLPGVKVGDSIPQSTYNAALNQYLDTKFPKPSSSNNGGVVVSENAQRIGDMIASGKFPPNALQNLGRNGTLRDQVMIHLANKGADLNGLLLDFDAEKAWLRTQNGSKFQSIRNNGTTLLHTLDRAEQAYNDLRKMVPAMSAGALNRGQLNILRQRNDRVGEAARRLDVLVADVVPEIGSMIMGGNSNTDHSLELASHNLSGEWNETQFLDAIKQARMTTNTRLAALSDSVPVTLKTSGPVYNAFVKIRASGIKTLQEFEAALVAKRSKGGTLEGDLRTNLGFSDAEIQELRDRFSEPQ